MPSINVGEHQLEYVWHGPSPDQTPTIVFLHEGLGCVAMWRDFPERVVEATGCGALVYSRAGYGNSDPIGLPRAVTFMHDEALNVLPAMFKPLGIGNAILFGHSDGGSIALIYAGSGKARNVHALILEAPHVFVEDLSIKSIIEAKNNYEDGSLKTSLERYHGSNVDCAFRGWNDVWLNPQFRSWNIENYLPQIKVPLLVIQGENDQYGTLNQVEAIKNECNGPVRTILLPDGGHAPHRDQPQLVVDAVARFVDEVRSDLPGVL